MPLTVPGETLTNYEALVSVDDKLRNGKNLLKVNFTPSETSLVESVRHSNGNNRLKRGDNLNEVEWRRVTSAEERIVPLHHTSNFSRTTAKMFPPQLLQDFAPSVQEA